MQITVYQQFFAIHDDDWEKLPPWIFIRKQRSHAPLPAPSAQGKAGTILLPLNWLFLPCT